MADKQHPCSNCVKSTKYRCITCKTYVCNRASCSMPVTDEEIEGWIPNVSVAYCNNCFLNPPSSPTDVAMSPTKLSDEDNDETDKEVTFILGKRHRKKKDSG
ncbi:Hypothetical predicted protein [Paramuricea clavata]|uniref:Uncharacterized protein n=1 Tax=Paramuricea clavata TaxID=317549 RepID=A0A6S7KGA1_PARCT|nr:Hypothetical predicted protein [Paramuricea clavata]